MPLARANSCHCDTDTMTPANLPPLDWVDMNDDMIYGGEFGFDFDFEGIDFSDTAFDFPMDVDFQGDAQMDSSAGLFDIASSTKIQQQGTPSSAEVHRARESGFDLEAWIAEQIWDPDTPMAPFQSSGIQDPQFSDRPLFTGDYPWREIDMAALMPPLPGAPTVSPSLDQSWMEADTIPVMSSTASSPAIVQPVTQPSHIFMCLVPKCGEVLDDGDALRTHYETLHGRMNHCLAPHCHRSFYYTKDLDRHALTHTKVKRCHCPVSGCGFHRKGFAREDTLWKHMKRAHGKEKPETRKKKSSRKSGVAVSSSSSNTSP